MKNPSRFVLSVCAPFACILFAGTVLAATPAGFSLIDKGEGVGLYRKTTARGSHYVQVVNLSKGASVRLLAGPVTDRGSGEGVYGGDNPRFTRQGLGEAWKGLWESSALAFSLVNGQFFDTNSTPATRLAFPLKVDGKIVSDGYGLTEYPEEKLILELWGTRANIRKLTKANLYGSSAPNVLAGLDKLVNKGATLSKQRTFAGVKDADGDSQYETVLLLSSTAATQAEAAKVLQDFGCAKVIMFDGGGSTQLRCKDRTLIPSTRRVPQTIAVLAGNAAALQIDGGPSSAREQGETFSMTGSNLPPGRVVRRWAKFNGTRTALGDLTADAQGRLQWQWTPTCTAATGTYTLWLELVGGARSNTVGETVLPTTFCTDSWHVRAYNVDDVASILLNGATLAEVGFNGDSGYLDVTDTVRSTLGATTFRFMTYNNQEGYTWGYEILRTPPGSGSIVFWKDEQGTVAQWGANDNDQSHTFQWVYDHTVTLQ